MVISSRTPEGSPHRCPICGLGIKIESSDPPGDAPCPHCGHLLWFTSEGLGDALVIKPARAILIAEDFDRLIETASGMRGMELVLDLGEVQSISSIVLGKLLKLKKAIEGVEGKLKLANPPPDLLEFLRITHLDRGFDLD